MNGAGDDARDEYSRLHWGIDPRRTIAVEPGATPRALAELGKLHSVTYATEKAGDGPSLYEHEFGGRRGSRRPVLAVDVDTGALHVVGGNYRVETRGIVG
jgi:hypothetical protein